MTLHPVYGHEELRRRLLDSATARRLPQSLLFTGPEGVGKQRLALWLGKALLCEAAPAERPCGRCRSCYLAADLQHPDLHWFFPVPSPKGSHTPEKRREKLEEARLELLAARRDNSVQALEPDRSTALYLPVIEEIRSRATRRPAMSSGTVFVVGDAERMVPQASSPEAANAFLKLLEEPPPDTVFVLTSSRPGLLLPTIWSRVLSVRVTPVDTPATVRFLEQETGLETARAHEVAIRSGGRIGAALRLSETDGDPRAPALRFVKAAIADRRSERWAHAASFAPAGARGGFSDLLDMVEAVLRDCITVALDSDGSALDHELAKRLPESRSIDSERWLSAVSHVDEARDAALGNGNPQAIAAVLLSGLARELRPLGSDRPERHRPARVSGAS
jgi:DNA polymerase-3 subunit delta'